MLALASLVGMMFLGVFAEGAVSLFKSDPEADDPDTSDISHSGIDGSSGMGDLLDDQVSQNEVQDGSVDHATGDDTADSSDTTVEPDPDVTLDGGSNADALSGNGGADRISGAGGSDVLDGRGGDDRLDGGDGGDAMHGGTGDDVLLGKEGSDDLHGEDGNDNLTGGSGNDFASGGENDDRLTGGDGADSLDGGSGNDTLLGNRGGDTLVGGFGDDRLDGGAGTDLLQGGYGNDTMSGADHGGTPEMDYLNGGDGDDLMQLGAHDMGYGATGADTFGLSDDFGSEGAATISDYNPAEDRIVVEYDAAAHPDPDVTVVADSEDPTSALIMMNGFVLAHVTGGAGLTVGDLDLRPLAA